MIANVKEIKKKKKKGYIPQRNLGVSLFAFQEMFLKFLWDWKFKTRQPSLACSSSTSKYITYSLLVRF